MNQIAIMNSINNSNCTTSNELETMTRFVSSLGCSWDTNGTNNYDLKSIASSSSIERIPARKVSHPSFLLTNDDHEKQEDEEKDDDSNSSSHRREAVQSKASKLMSRKDVYSQDKDEDNGQQAQPPQRIMLENILDSFDQLVDARIRAYACILSNHVQVLSESNNARGARIAEYKLQTLLEFAANHLLFDSVSTEFTTSVTEDNTCDSNAISITTKATEEEQGISLPIELTVEIQSPRFFHEGLEAINRMDDANPPHRRHPGKLTFRAKGKVRADRIVIGRGHNKVNDTDRCLTPGADVCRNSKESIPINSFFENIDIEIDCNALLSQMMEEASKVVTMAVESTNLAWTNNTQKQEEINDMSMNDMMAENMQETANIIDDDDSSTAVERLPERMTGKRSRREDHPDNDTHTGTIMSNQVSELSLSPYGQVVCDEERIEEHKVSNVASTSSATITNLHVLDQDAERKTRYFVSVDPSYESLGSDHDPAEDCVPNHQDDADECYNKIAAERACSIVDFVLAGDIIPCALSSNKKLRTK